MTNEVIRSNFQPRPATSYSMTLIIAICVVALIAGFLGGTLSSQFMTGRSTQSAMQPPAKETSEITVSKDGLLFKTEEGTPILRLGMGTYGAYLNLLNSESKTVVQLSENRGSGVFTVGTSDMTSVYIIGHDDGGTISMTGKYGKQVVRLSSLTEGGGGSLAINEGAQGYQAVEISTKNRKKNSRGIIKILNDTGTEWEAP